MCWCGGLSGLNGGRVDVDVRVCDCTLMWGVVACVCMRVCLCVRARWCMHEYVCAYVCWCARVCMRVHALYVRSFVRKGLFSPECGVPDLKTCKNTYINTSVLFDGESEGYLYLTPWQYSRNRDSLIVLYSWGIFRKQVCILYGYTLYIHYPYSIFGSFPRSLHQ